MFIRGKLIAYGVVRSVRIKKLNVLLFAEKRSNVLLFAVKRPNVLLFVEKMPNVLLFAEKIPNVLLFAEESPNVLLFAENRETCYSSRRIVKRATLRGVKRCASFRKRRRFLDVIAT